MGSELNVGDMTRCVGLDPAHGRILSRIYDTQVGHTALTHWVERRIGRQYVGIGLAKRAATEREKEC